MFIKERSECGNVDGCKFTGDVFQTDDEDTAIHLRRSATFGKTVKEITEPENPVIDYSGEEYPTLVSMCKDRGLRASGRKEELIDRLMENDREHQ